MSFLLISQTCQGIPNLVHWYVYSSLLFYTELMSTILLLILVSFILGVWHYVSQFGVFTETLSPSSVAVVQQVGSGVCTKCYNIRRLRNTLNDVSCMEERKTDSYQCTYLQILFRVEALFTIADGFVERKPLFSIQVLVCMCYIHIYS